MEDLESLGLRTVTPPPRVWRRTAVSPKDTISLLLLIEHTEFRKYFYILSMPEYVSKFLTCKSMKNVFDAILVSKWPAKTVNFKFILFLLVRRSILR